MDKGKAYYEKAVEALCRCRLDQAQQLFKQAAQEYSALFKQERNNVELYKLNAAVCFYWSGCYDESISIIDTIRHTRLEMNLQTMCNDLYEEARKRRRGSYWEGITHDLGEMRQKHLHKDILSLLNKNPFCLRNKDYAQQMRDSCLSLEMFEVASLFEADLLSIINEEKETKINYYTSGTSNYTTTWA